MSQIPTLTPEQRAEEYIGKADTVTQQQLRRVVADIIRQEREACAAAIERARERIHAARDGAAREANRHQDHDRAMFCDGTAHGLREALRMLGEEMGR